MILRFGFAAHLLAATVLMLSAAPQAGGQGIDVQNRPVADIQIKGLKQTDVQLVLNNIRMKKGDPYDERTVGEDVVRLDHLNRFSYVGASVEPQPDGSLVLIYEVVEQALIADVQVVGNESLPDAKLLAAARLRAGDPVSDFLIDRAKKQIVQTYEQAGYFDTSVEYDQEMLNDTGILLLRVVEGEKVRIRALKFQGNRAYSDKQLSSRIRSKKYIFLLRAGEMSRERTRQDAALLREFYRERGYLGANVRRDVQVSPDRRDAVVTFIIEEGKQYIVSQIEVQGNEVFSDAAILEASVLRAGDVFSINRKSKTEKALENLYGELGFIKTRATAHESFHEDEPQKVDVLINIVEGKPYWVGTVTIKGNQLTKDRVIKRQIRRIDPGRPFVRSGLETTKKRLNNSPLFERGTAQVTVLGEDEDDYRDVLIEVKEANTGSVGFGAGISSDAGVVGSFDITQRNFDIADWPENVGEFITGKALRGAGQFMRIQLQPGNRSSRYVVDFREPYLLDSNLFLDTRGFFFDRQRSDYDEERLGGAFGIGQRFGDVWSASIRTRFENIDISDIDDDAPVDVFRDEGENDLTSLGLSVTRNTTDDRFFPTRGSRITAGVSRIGALGGNYDFTKTTLDVRKFWTVDEDFFERRTVLSARMNVGYIPDGRTPVFERFYAGGHRSFRGFEFRGVGPRGIQNNTGRKGNDPVGGEWIFLLGLEYNVPIFQEILRGVVFIDTGTVQEDFGLDEYRASVGAGIRLKLPFLGAAPFAFDFAAPILRQDDDAEQVFSFDLAIPF